MRYYDRNRRDPYGFTGAAGDGGALSDVLLDIGSSRSLYPADDDRAYRENRAAFEAQIRQALSRLT